jgi:exosome complex component RRP42
MATSKSEQSYIVSSLLTEPPLRADGRSLLDYRPIALETQVADLANGSARVSIGGPSLGGIGVGGGIASTEVVAAVKLEVENIEKKESEGRIVCSVSW